MWSHPFMQIERVSEWIREWVGGWVVELSSWVELSWVSWVEWRGHAGPKPPHFQNWIISCWNGRVIKIVSQLVDYLMSLIIDSEPALIVMVLMSEQQEIFDWWGLLLSILVMVVQKYSKQQKWNQKEKRQGTKRIDQRNFLRFMEAKQSQKNKTDIWHKGLST